MLGNKSKVLVQRVVDEAVARRRRAAEISDGDARWVFLMNLSSGREAGSDYIIQLI